MQRNILQYLENTVTHSAQKTAFANDKEALTFEELYDKSRAIGSFLSEKGYYNKPVVVLMSKRPATIAAFLGVIYSGCYYVLLDEEMPVHRMELILNSLKNTIIIYEKNTEKTLNNLKYEGNTFCYEDISDTKINENVLQTIRNKQIDTDPIYIVFTSGSTGIPKGVTACHRSVIDYTDNLTEVMGFDNQSVFGNQAPLYVDGILKDMVPTLKTGATTYLIPKKFFMFPILLIEFLNDNRINTICWVASALQIVSSVGALDKQIPRYLRTIAFGSEVFPVKQLKIWKKHIPNARYFNLYGPTEATGMSCYYEVTQEFNEDEVIPIGRPFPNTEIILLDNDKIINEPNVAGEICIRGTSLTLGYYQNFNKTNEVFIQNPINNLYPELIYLTGDLGKFNEKGELIYIARKDNQIKHMGYRIELNEIELTTNSIDNINSVCCIYDNNKKKIILFYVGESTNEALLNDLKRKLPRYMLPNEVVKMDKMPYTLNGKLDRMKLKEIYEQGE